jgi:hypothetical protein
MEGSQSFARRFHLNRGSEKLRVNGRADIL